jgi:hypothetical protein
VLEPSHTRCKSELQNNTFVDWGTVELPEGIVQHYLGNTSCKGYIYVDERPATPMQVPPQPGHINVFISELVSALFILRCLVLTVIQLLTAIRFNESTRLDVHVADWATFRDVMLGNRVAAVTELSRFDLIYGGADLMLDLR